jgi:hypothetical protein
MVGDLGALAAEFGKSVGGHAGKGRLGCGSDERNARDAGTKKRRTESPARN